MPRTARKISSTGYYHVMMRGVNRQNIFTEERDFSFFVFLLGKFTAEMKAEIITYCLMSNHVHLLIKTDEADLLVKKISSAYVKYFNKKYNRIGHLFQERYKSEPVENDTYLLTVTRYILCNPQKAGIARFDQYRWNGWNDFIYPVLCNTKIILEMVGGKSLMREFMEQPNNDKCIDFNECKYMENDEIVEYILDKFDFEDINQIQEYSKEKIAYLLHELKEEGFTTKQLALATGIGRGIIQRA